MRGGERKQKGGGKGSGGGGTKQRLGSESEGEGESGAYPLGPTKRKTMGGRNGQDIRFGERKKKRKTQLGRRRKQRINQHGANLQEGGHQNKKGEA